MTETKKMSSEEKAPDYLTWQFWVVEVLKVLLVSFLTLVLARWGNFFQSKFDDGQIKQAAVSLNENEKFQKKLIDLLVQQADFQARIAKYVVTPDLKEHVASDPSFRSAISKELSSSERFVASCKGPAGPRGPKGDVGPQGPKGGILRIKCYESTQIVSKKYVSKNEQNQEDENGKWFTFDLGEGDVGLRVLGAVAWNSNNELGYVTGIRVGHRPDAGVKSTQVSLRINRDYTDEPRNFRVRIFYVTDDQLEVLKR